MLHTTIGQLAVNRALPPELRDYRRTLTKASIGDVLNRLAQEHPEEYRDRVQKLMHEGAFASYVTGGDSFGLDDIRQTEAAKMARQRIHEELQQILQNPGLDADQKNKQIILLAGRHQKGLIDQVFQESQDQDNPLVRQISGAGRGNKFNLNSLRGMDLLYQDHNGNVIPVPVLHSYSQGLRPMEYFAASFGARKGIVDLQKATAQSGFLAKQMMQASHRLLVSNEDAPDAGPEAELRGLPSRSDDPDNEGALLARSAGPYPRNTLLTSRVLKDLQARGLQDILVRSPLVGGPADGGVYARDVGVRNRGRLSPIGDYVGPAAAQSLSEPITQSMLSSKHSGGVAGASAGAISGFRTLNAMIQVPEIYPNAAAHAQLDGRITAIDPAPQGGHYVYVGGKRHYVPADQQVTVEPHAEIEAGDVLSSGTPDPSEIVKHKGIGEGRRYFTEAFRNLLKAQGTSAHRRNIELLARGLINHVRLTDEVGDWVPDDVVPYSVLEASWRPRPGAARLPIASTHGQYLEVPVLHYTVGTKVTKPMQRELTKHGIDAIQVHQDPPPFEPEMIRGMANISHDPDPFSKLLGSYQQKSLLHSVHRGLVSDTAGTSFVPALAQGSEFGRSGLTKGWNPNSP